VTVLTVYVCNDDRGDNDVMTVVTMLIESEQETMTANPLFANAIKTMIRPPGR
jgi:hypothetical protein